MGKTLHVLLIFWSFLQTALSVYLLWGLVILIRMMNTKALILFLLPTLLLNFAVAYLSVYLTGEIQKDRKKRLLFKTLSNFISAPFKLVVHLIVLVLSRFIKTKMSYGGFDNDNKASVFVYALSYIDFEPLWGDFKDKEAEENRRPAWARALRESIYLEDKHILFAPSENRKRRKAYSHDIFEKAEAVAYICSSKVKVFGNEVEVRLCPVMNKNVITFFFSLKPEVIDQYSSTEESELFQEQVKKKTQAIQETVSDMMIQWADVRELDRNYEFGFAIELEL